jgi:hypothetical protein
MRLRSLSHPHRSCVLLEGRNEVLATRLKSGHVFADYFIVKDNITFHISSPAISRDIACTVICVPSLKLNCFIVIIE